MPKYRNDNSALVVLSCAIVFILFVFLYLFFLEADILEMTQHVLSKGSTHYNRIVGTIIITIVLFLIQLGVTRLTAFSGALYALNFFPSLLLLSILTIQNPDFKRIPFYGSWFWIAPLLLILYIGVVYVYQKNMIPTQYSIHKGRVVRLIWINLLTLSMMFFAISALGSSPKVFMYRIHMEGLLKKDKPLEALKVGRKSSQTDENLTLLRIYALSKTNKLADRLFSYPLMGGSKSLLPDGDSIKTLLISQDDIIKRLSKRKKGSLSPKEYLEYAQNNGIAQRGAIDYLLCGYLMDKDLDSFYDLLPLKYSLNDSLLPKYYKEALALQNHIKAYPLTNSDTIIDSRCQRFLEIYTQEKDSIACYAKLRNIYDKTYWLYYFY